MNNHKALVLMFIIGQGIITFLHYIAYGESLTRSYLITLAFMFLGISIYGMANWLYYEYSHKTEEKHD